MITLGTERVNLQVQQPSETCAEISTLRVRGTIIASSAVSTVLSLRNGNAQTIEERVYITLAAFYVIAVRRHFRNNPAESYANYGLHMKREE